ncbi:MAG: metallophosphoesterase [Bacteroidales bacterium]|nr:metallophosphoesterase [Candidatus Cacconaster merdequi]
MKRVLFFILAACIASLPTVDAQNIYSIETEPSEDCSSGVRISWAADTSLFQTYVLYTKATDSQWKNALQANAEESWRCETYNGIWSDDASGREFYEDAVFVKCGTTLSGLKPDTEYKYVITDGTERSREHRFRTAGAKEWSACIISDIHSYTPLPGRLASAMSMIDTVQTHGSPVHFVLSPGDVVAWGSSYSFWKRLFEENNFEEMMWARVNGNHDNWTKQSQVDRKFELPNDFFLGSSYFPRNGYEGEEGVCYHFRYGDLMCVMLNTEDMHSKEGFEAARDWLEKVVAEARASKNAPRYIAVLMHYEWFIGTSGKTSEYGRWHDTFDRLGIDLAVAGNNHVYVRTPAIYDGEPTDGSKGTVYVVTSSSDNGRGRSFSDAPMLNDDLIQTRWTEGPHTVSAIYMNVNRKRIKLTLLNRYGEVIDSCEVVAKAR